MTEGKDLISDLHVTDGIVISGNEKQRLVTALARFRAARYRNMGSGVCRKDDICNAENALETVIKRHSEKR